MFRRNIRDRNILFLCEDNACLSQIAEAIAQRLLPPKIRVYSAGIRPREICPHVTKVMQEADINISDQHPKGLEAVPLDEIDLAITLGEGPEKYPNLPATVRLRHWSIPDPQRASGGEAAMQAVYRYVRDEIDKKVAALFLDYWRNIA
jgi:protein-tyrosine-phosphatase